MFIHRKGQSTVEYILLVTAVIAVIILFTTNKTAGLQGKLTNTLNTTAEYIGTMETELTESRPAAPANSASPAPIIKITPDKDFNSGRGDTVSRNGV